MWVSVITAIVAVGSLIGTAVSISETSDNAANDRQLQQRGQASDRYLKAVEQLAAPTPDLRLGGIYALDQLYNDSPLDTAQIVSVLLAYIRNHAPVATCPRVPERTAMVVPLQAPDYGYEPPADIQAAIRVIGRRPVPAARALDLSRLCLRQLNMTGLYFIQANFRASYAVDASLDDTDLTASTFLYSDFERSFFHSAILDNSSLSTSKFAGSDFEQVSFKYSNISDSDMSGITIADSDFSGSSVVQSNVLGSSFAYLRALPTRFEATRAGASIRQALDNSAIHDAVRH